jgi:hypothetical protein
MDKFNKSSPPFIFREFISLFRLANQGNTEIVMGEF